MQSLDDKTLYLLFLQNQPIMQKSLDELQKTRHEPGLNNLRNEALKLV
jgi:hypothetical protein